MKSSGAVKVIFDNNPKEEITLKPMDLEYKKLLAFVQKKVAKGENYTI
jgi:hypothetical protein